MFFSSHAAGNSFDVRIDVRLDRALRGRAHFESHRRASRATHRSIAVYTSASVASARIGPKGCRAALIRHVISWGVLPSEARILVVTLFTRSPKRLRLKYSLRST